MRFLAIDPSLSNFGLAFGRIDISTGRILGFDQIKLVSTQNYKSKHKGISTYLRAQNIARVLKVELQTVDLVMAEEVSGGRNYSSALSLGVAMSILGCVVEKPVVFVLPKQVKQITGNPKADKKQMIAWAYKMHPNLQWLWYQGKLKNANEHMADALGVSYAGANKIKRLGLAQATKL